MMNIKVILLLSLATYASCTGGYLSTSDEEEPIAKIRKIEGCFSAEASSLTPAEYQPDYKLKVLEILKESYKVETEQDIVDKLKIKADAQAVFDAYIDCLHYAKTDLNAPIRFSIPRSLVAEYMGEMSKFIDHFFVDHPKIKVKDYAELNTIQFGEVFMYLCEKQKIPIQVCAEQKRNERQARKSQTQKKQNK